MIEREDTEEMTAENNDFDGEEIIYDTEDTLHINEVVDLVDLIFNSLLEIFWKQLLLWYNKTLIGFTIAQYGRINLTWSLTQYLILDLNILS